MTLLSWTPGTQHRGGRAERRQEFKAEARMMAAGGGYLATLEVSADVEKTGSGSSRVLYAHCLSIANRSCGCLPFSA